MGFSPFILLLAPFLVVAFLLLPIIYRFGDYTVDETVNRLAGFFELLVVV